MKADRARKFGIRTALSIAMTWSAGSALAQHYIKCAATAVLGASGYPGPKRTYELRGSCQVLAYNERNKQVYIWGPIPSPGVADSNDYYEDVLDFIALAKVSWDGKTGKTTEDMLIDGTSFGTTMNCVQDPFTAEQWSPCSDPHAAGSVDLVIHTGVIESRCPVFGGSVSQSLAEKLSNQGPKGGAPPPPTPAPRVTIPIGKKQSGGPAEAAGPHVPVSASGRKKPGGDSSAAGAGAVIVTSPRPAPTRAASRLVLPTSGSRQTSGASSSLAMPRPGSSMAVSPTASTQSSARAANRRVLLPSPTPTPAQRRRS